MVTRNHRGLKGAAKLAPAPTMLKFRFDAAKRPRYLFTNDRRGALMKYAFTVCVFSLASQAFAAPSIPLTPAPLFPRGSVVDVIQGTSVADPYRTLEDAKDSKVQVWSDTENARTRMYLDALPGRAAIAAKLTRLIKDSSPGAFFLQPRGSGVFAFYLDPARSQQPFIVVLNAAADPASRRTVVDPNVFDPTGHTAIDWFIASPDGGKIAVSLSLNGSEDGALHVFDTVTGKEVEAPIDRVQYPTAGGALAWTGDSKGFWYTRYPDASAPETERHFNQALYLHKLGANTADDQLVLGPKNGLTRTAEIYLDGNRGGVSALASVELGDGGQFQHFVLTPDGRALQISRYEDHVIGGAIIADDGTVFGVSRLNAPMGQVLKLAPPYAGGFPQAQLIVPEEQTAAIIDGSEFGKPLLVTKDHLFVQRIAGGPSAVSVYDLSGRQATLLDQPPVSDIDDMVAMPDGSLFYDVETYLEPPYYSRWNPKTGRSTRTAIEMTSPISFDDAQVARVFAMSLDGTKIPISIISRRGVKLDGSHPLLLNGYGGYGVSTTPKFAGTRARLWLDGGGIYAEANIRGGSEYGEIWHHQGMLTRKQNVFDDFDAAGEALISLGYTNHAKLALIGASNGGLLMGAMITQHPDLARVVVSSVGIYDMIRVENDPNGAFNVTEFGSIKDPDQFKALYAYSPYHHVRSGVGYPAVFMQTGATDGRVNPMQSRKFTAALQAATSSGYPILLATSKDTGHGMGSSLDETIREGTDRTMFLFDQLGMDAVQAAK